MYVRVHASVIAYYLEAGVVLGGCYRGMKRLEEGVGRNQAAGADVICLHYDLTTCFLSL